jgi:(1->4)-alpha-D-glucan 1-alpha-D-glucosylmutase
VTVEPRATYRLQFGVDCGFAEAAEIASYLAELGVSHLYASPYLASASGTHGYDVVDHARVEPRLGGHAAHRAMCASLAAHGLGQLLDIVPNHMAIAGRDNPLWWDVLANGRASRFAPYFDIDWRPPEERMRDTLLLPILGDHYGRVLEAGELRLERREAEFTLRYHERELPISPRTLDVILRPAAERCGSEELADLASDLLRLPDAAERDPVNVQVRHRESGRLLDTLARLVIEVPGVAEALDAATAAINDDPDALDALLERPTGISRTGASSTSTRWSRCESRTRRCSRASTSSSCGGSVTGRWMACGSTTSTACVTRRATSTGSAAKLRMRGCWSRRSSSATRCPRRAGRSTAPPATSSHAARPAS